jgi:hypothetical protein
MNWTERLFIPLFLCICVCVYLQTQGSLRECRWISAGRFRAILLLRTTCMVPDVIGLLAVWRHNKPKTKPNWPELPVRDYTEGCNRSVPRRSKMSAMNVTARIIFERLCLVPGPRQFALFFTMPSAPTTPPLTRRLFLDFCAIFFPSGPSYFWSARFAK